MFAEFVEALVLIVRGALFAGLCWGAWLCLGEQVAPAKPAKHLPPKFRPLTRFAAFAALVLLLSAVGILVQGG